MPYRQERFIKSRCENVKGMYLITIYINEDGEQWARNTLRNVFTALGLPSSLMNSPAFQFAHHYAAQVEMVITRREYLINVLGLSAEAADEILNLQEPGG